MTVIKEHCDGMRNTIPIITRQNMIRCFLNMRWRVSHCKGDSGDI